MDAQRFDALIRGLATSISRRGALKTAIGIALAGASARITSRGANADNMGPCADFGLPCSPGECCHPYVCRAGSSTSICGACLEKAAFCSSDEECCDGNCEFSFRRFWWVCQKEDRKKKKRHKKDKKDEHD